MACICFHGPREVVHYYTLDAARNGKPDGGELVLCSWCEGLISRVPTYRERLYAEGKLPWQNDWQTSLNTETPAQVTNDSDSDLKERQEPVATVQTGF